MAEPLEIKLLKGLNSITFGEKIESAIFHFGAPQEIQKLNDPLLNSNALVYHYWHHEFSLFFNVNNHHRFYSAQIENKQSLMYEQKIFLLTEKEIILLMKSNGYALTDSEMQKWGEKRLTFDAVGLDCYLKNNNLVSINFTGPDTENDFYH